MAIQSSPIDDTLHVSNHERKRAEMWLEKIAGLWKPLGRIPTLPGDSLELALRHDLQDWERGSRMMLVCMATDRTGPSREAFVTLGCRDYLEDLREPGEYAKWLLPLQLAWAWDGVPMTEDGLPKEMP